MSEKILVDVVHALAGHQDVRRMELDDSSTVRDALAAGGYLELIPALGMPGARIGIFGRIVRPETLLRNGDRLEIYRPLIADPREARRLRARRVLPR